MGDEPVRGLIDFSRLVGVLMMCVACFFTDGDVRRIMKVIRDSVARVIR